MKKIVLVLTLLLYVGIVRAQRATKIEKIGEESWKVIVPIKPKGQNGPFIDEAEFIVVAQVTHPPNTSYGNNLDRVTVGARGGRTIVHKYRYQGVDYDVNKDLGGVGYSGYKSFTYRITIANAGSVSGSWENVIGVDKNKSAVIPLGKTLSNTEGSALQEKLSVTSFEITGYELVQTDLDDVARKVSAKKQNAGANTSQTAGSGTQTTRSGTSSSGQGQTSATTTGSATNSTQGNTNNNVDIGQAIADYNATEKAKSDALNAATKETTSQWAQGNYIQGAKPLADEFARQGSAAGVYGTVGVAAAAEIGSAIFAGRAERKAREAAYDYEFDQGLASYNNGNFNEALKWYHSSYEQGKNKGSSADGMGSTYFKIKNYTEAKKWFDIAISLKAATVNTYFYLSKMFLNGFGVAKDEQRAFKLMEIAAGNTGYFSPEATYHLAFLYLTGKGVTQNYKKAYDLFLSIPSGGPGTPGYSYNDEVDFALGVMYYHGLGLKKNIEEARKYFEKCADNYDAQQMLSKITGRGSLYNNSAPNNATTHDTFGKFLNL